MSFGKRQLCLFINESNKTRFLKYKGKLKCLSKDHTGPKQTFSSRTFSKEQSAWNTANRVVGS